MNNKSKFLKFALSISKEAGEIQKSYFGKISKYDSKSTKADLVSKADLESEKLIINRIKETFPSHNILSEEIGKINNNSNYQWVIDPLDGTTNFLHNLPIYAVSIGLRKNNKTICGVVYNPAANKCFYSEHKKGSFLNNVMIKPTSCNTLSESLLVTGFPYVKDKKYDESFNIFKEFYDNSRGMRRLGAAALDLCFVAMGRFDGFYEFGLQPWDICAGALILEEAGGVVTDWNNAEYPNSGIRILGTNGKIHKQMIKILNQKKYNLFY